MTGTEVVVGVWCGGKENNKGGITHTASQRERERERTLYETMIMSVV